MSNDILNDKIEKRLFIDQLDKAKSMDEVKALCMDKFKMSNDNFLYSQPITYQQVSENPQYSILIDNLYLEPLMDLNSVNDYMKSISNRMIDQIHYANRNAYEIKVANKNYNYDFGRASIQFDLGINLYMFKNLNNIHFENMTIEKKRRY